MRWSLGIILVCLALLATRGAAEEQNPRVAAATADALEALKRQIVPAHITQDLTVEDLLEKVGGQEALDKTLHGAEQIGGPRWLGDQAVQVRLSIDGSRIAKALEDLVKAHAKQSPIPPEVLRRQTKWWADRIFSATGTSTSAGELTRLRPSPADRAWWKVADSDRRRALLAARNNAMDHLVQNLAPLPLAQGKTLGGALANPAVSKAIRDWLDGQPVESVKFNDDLTVQVTFATPVDSFWGALRGALSQQHDVPLPANPSEWDRLRNEVIAHLGPAAGTGLVQPGPATRPADSPRLPVQAPAWVTQSAQAEATSPASGSQLHTARKAETLAIEKLRDQMHELPLSPGTTVGDLAGREPAVEQAVAKALTRARPYQVEYGVKGAVTVHVSVRLAELWADLSGQQ